MSCLDVSTRTRINVLQAMQHADTVILLMEKMEKTMTNVETLCADWLEAKREETAANKRRIAIEEQIAQALDVPAEGSKTHKLDSFKVTMTQPVTRKLDADAWALVSDKIPPALHPVKVTLSADATGCKYLANNEPEIWAICAKAIETKPGKVGVKVEAV